MKVIMVAIWVRPNAQQGATPEKPTPYRPNPMDAMTGAIVRGEMYLRRTVARPLYPKKNWRHPDTMIAP